MNGVSVKSCTILAVQADGADILTIEGLGSTDNLYPMQEGFWEMHGLQCGDCTPGMINGRRGAPDEIRLDGRGDSACAGRQHCR